MVGLCIAQATVAASVLLPLHMYGVEQWQLQNRRLRPDVNRYCKFINQHIVKSELLQTKFTLQSNTPPSNRATLLSSKKNHRTTLKESTHVHVTESTLKNHAPNEKTRIRLTASIRNIDIFKTLANTTIGSQRSQR